MDPVSAIVTALIAGATAAASGIAEDALKDAYSGLKSIMVNTYKLVSASLLDKNPHEKAYQGAVETEIRNNPAISSDDSVLEKVMALQTALKAAPSDKLTAWGVNVDEITAGHNVVAKNISSLRAKKISAVHDVILSGIGRPESSGNV